MNRITKRISAMGAAAIVGCMLGGAAMAEAPKSVPAAKLTPAKRVQPTAYMVSDAHLDTQWNWDVQTTIKEYVWNTLNQNLYLLERFPNYVFNFEGGVKYAWMKEYYPAQYEQMKKYIKDGRWHICGASWDATDAIVPSPESAIRNIMLGQQLYRDEFGVESTDIFLPDCFGFGWNLPTVASHCGLIGFSSHKMGWRHKPFYEGNKRYPFSFGLWQGVDGSKIMMAHGFNYGQRYDQGTDLTNYEELKRRIAESPLNVAYHYYGTGDVGGSPTLSSVDAIERAVTSGKGPVKIVSATSDQLYKEYLPFDQHPEVPVFDGELLMDVHGTGCYSSQAAMKLYNRQNELLGDAAERASMAADLLGAAPYPTSRLTEAWRRFIFHQFHDDLTGTSIPRAYEFSWNDELLSLKQFSDILTDAAGAVGAKMDTRVKGTPVVLFNATGSAATSPVEIALAAAKAPKSVEAIGPDGKKARAQVVGYADGKAKVLVEAAVPANGFAVYDIRLSGSAAAPAAKKAQSVENSVYRLTFDANGDITSLTDKRNGKELVAPGKAIRLAMFTENESFEWPAWEIIKSTLDKDPVSVTENVEMAMVENGPLRKTIRVKKSFGPSEFVQYISLYEGDKADRIDFRTDVDWKSTNALLKAEFPVSFSAPEATYDMGIGAIRRGNSTPIAYEVPAQYWADLTAADNSYGITVMNDSKYGWDKPNDNTLRLTLLHTPKTKGGYTYQDRQDNGHHSFTYTLTGHSGALNKAATCRNAEQLNQGVKAFAVAKHPGALGKSFSLATIDNKALAIKALKGAEASDEYVVRIYDTANNGDQTGTVTFPREIISAVAADGTEKTTGEATFSGRNLSVAVNPNGIRTYKVRLAKDAAAAATEQPLQLAYDKKCFSWNAFGGDADFEGGYAYAAELVPATLNVDGVNFNLENKEILNGKMCAGDTIALPEGHNFNRLYVLASAATAEGELPATFTAGNQPTTVNVPSYTGFIGQWGHDGHTEGYLTDSQVAYVGTHRHSSDGDHPYEFTYMFKYAIPVPAGAKQIVLPADQRVVLFAATLGREDAPAQAASTLFRTGNVAPSGAGNVKPNLLNPSMITAYSGFVNDRERPEMLVDGKIDTKWCDTKPGLSFVEFDLGKSTPFNSWKLVNAGSETASYVTACCMLQTRDSKDEEWKTVDLFSGNKRNVVSRALSNPATARYVRLLVVQPTQEADSNVARLYELGLYE